MCPTGNSGAVNGSCTRETLLNPQPGHLPWLLRARADLLAAAAR